MFFFIVSIENWNAKTIIWIRVKCIWPGKKNSVVSISFLPINKMLSSHSSQSVCVCTANCDMRDLWALYVWYLYIYFTIFSECVWVELWPRSEFGERICFLLYIYHRTYQPLLAVRSYTSRPKWTISFSKKILHIALLQNKGIIWQSVLSDNPSGQYSIIRCDSLCLFFSFWFKMLISYRHALWVSASNRLNKQKIGATAQYIHFISISIAFVNEHFTRGDFAP